MENGHCQWPSGVWLSLLGGSNTPQVDEMPGIGLEQLALFILCLVMGPLQN